MGMLVILLGFMVAATTFEGFLSHGGIFNHLSLKKKMFAVVVPYWEPLRWVHKSLLNGN